MADIFLNIDLFRIIDEYTDFQAGGSVGFPWFNPRQVFDLDLHAIDSYMPSGSTKWFMRSSELDVDKEEATVELKLKVI